MRDGTMTTTDISGEKRAEVLRAPKWINSLGTHMSCMGFSLEHSALCWVRVRVRVRTWPELTQMWWGALVNSTATLKLCRNFKTPPKRRSVKVIKSGWGNQGYQRSWETHSTLKTNKLTHQKIFSTMMWSSKSKELNCDGFIWWAYTQDWGHWRPMAIAET